MRKPREYKVLFPDVQNRILSFMSYTPYILSDDEKSLGIQCKLPFWHENGYVVLKERMEGIGKPAPTLNLTTSQVEELKSFIQKMNPENYHLIDDSYRVCFEDEFAWRSPPAGLLAVGDQLYLKSPITPTEDGTPLMGSFSELNYAFPVWVANPTQVLVIGPAEALKTKSVYVEDESNISKQMFFAENSIEKTRDIYGFGNPHVSTIHVKKPLQGNCLSVECLEIKFLEPWIQGGTLRHFLAQNPTIDQRLDATIAVLMELKVYQTKKIAHLDISLGNIIYNGQKATFIDRDFSFFLLKESECIEKSPCEHLWKYVTPQSDISHVRDILLYIQPCYGDSKTQKISPVLARMVDKDYEKNTDGKDITLTIQEFKKIRMVRVFQRNTLIEELKKRLYDEKRITDGIRKLQTLVYKFDQSKSDNLKNFYVKKVYEELESRHNKIHQLNDLTRPIYELFYRRSSENTKFYKNWLTTFNEFLYINKELISSLHMDACPSSRESTYG